MHRRRTVQAGRQVTDSPGRRKRRSTYLSAWELTAVSQHRASAAQFPQVGITQIEISLKWHDLHKSGGCDWCCPCEASEYTFLTGSAASGSAENLRRVKLA